MPAEATCRSPWSSTATEDAGCPGMLRSAPSATAMATSSGTRKGPKAGRKLACHWNRQSLNSPSSARRQPEDRQADPHHGCERRHVEEQRHPLNEVTTLAG